MLLHVDPRATKPHAFHLEAHTLFKLGFKSRLQLSACAENTMPGKCISVLSQNLGNLPVKSWVSGCSRHLSVGRHLAPGNSAN